MADYGRYGSPNYDERSRQPDRYREAEERGGGHGGFFSADRDDSGRGGIFSADRDDSMTRRDRPRERMFRDNRPSGSDSSGGFFGRDRDEWGGRLRQDSGRERSQARHRDDEGRHLPIDETDQLIASNKVEGTPVYGREGERLGTIYNFMVDKYSGRVEYAVMSYGGFLGVGQRYYPLPWRILSYDTREGGYRVDLDYRDLERAPSFGREDEPRFNRHYGRQVHSWYGLDY